MARPHHRKKHKAHLRQFQHSHDIKTGGGKGSGSTVFAIVGAIVGFAIMYFATQGNIIWLIVGTIAGGFAGYFIGKSVDKAAKK